jgi:hypothetical protein
MRKKNKELRNKIQEKSEKTVESFLRYTKLDKGFGRILEWAENNRKSMFAITISFLVGVVFLTFINRASRSSFGKTYNDIEANYIDSISPFNALKSKGQSVTNNIEQLFLLQKFKTELNEMQKKGYLTKEDSLKIIEMYNTIKN